MNGEKIAMKSAVNEKNTPSPTGDLPIIRGNGYDLERIRGVYAAWKELELLEKAQERRIKTIPGGWRDLKLCRTLLKKLADNMVRTLQPEKRGTVQRMGTRMFFRVWTGPEAIKTTPDEVVLLNKELDAIIEAAHDNACKMCMQTNCRSCKLGKALDNVLSMDRGDRCWSHIDLSEAKEDDE